MDKYINKMLCDAYSPTIPSWLCNQLQKNNINPHSPPLHNSTTVPVLEVNLLPACEDEVHLIVHTNGPRKAFKMIEWLCFGSDNWKLKLVSAYRHLSSIIVVIIMLMY